MSSKNLEIGALREEIRHADAEITRGVVRRLKLARRLAHSKSRHGLPLRDYGVERDVIRRWVRQLGLTGVDAGRSEALARWFIEESVRVQEPILHRPRRRTRSGALDIAIVGGAGAMGRWLTEFFESYGHRISVVDPRAPGGPRPTFGDVESAAEGSDALVFATPMAGTARPLRKVLGGRKDLLIFDILSVKAPIAGLLSDAARAGRRVTSVHPMFGPSARTLSGRNLLIVKCGNPEADAAARALFEHSALTVTEIRLRDHDRLMAESLGLSHAMNLLFLGALSSSSLSPAMLSRVASTTFHRQSSLALSVAREGVELYLDIQASNPFSRAVFRGIRSRLTDLEAIVARRDLAGFRQWLAEGRAMIEPTSAPMRS